MQPAPLSTELIPFWELLWFKLKCWGMGGWGGNVGLCHTTPISIYLITWLRASIDRAAGRAPAPRCFPNQSASFSKPPDWNLCHLKGWAPSPVLKRLIDFSWALGLASSWRPAACGPGQLLGLSMCPGNQHQHSIHSPPHFTCCP